MRALLRADWLRFRSRKDLWIIAIAVLVFGALTFLSGYRGEVVDPEYPDAAASRQEARDLGFFEGTPGEVDAQIEQYVIDQQAQFEQQLAEWEANQRIELQKYGFPQSLFTLIKVPIAPILALILIGSLAVGDEFRYGTLRTSLLAAGDRRRFLGARLVTLLATTAGLFAALALLGVVFGLALTLGGADVGVGTTPVDLAAAAAWLAGQVLIAFVLITLAAALTVLLRSGALPILLIVIGSFVELFVANLPFFRPGESLAGVPQVLLTWNIRTLIVQLGLDTHALAFARSEVPFQPIVVPPIVVAAIIAAWGSVFAALADRRLRTMDVVE